MFKKHTRFYRIILILFGCLLATFFSCNYLFYQSIPQDKYQIHFIDVGQGDAILVMTPDKTLLVDGGPRNSNVSDYLNQQEIEEIDIVIATHPHADHIGGLIDVLELFPVYDIIDSGIPHTTITYNDYLTLIDQLDIPFTVGRRGMRKDIGENEFIQILHPASPSENNLNNASVVVKITLDEITVLLTSDVEMVGEHEMLLYKPDLLQSDILKVAHHGSSTSSTMNFLKAVSPNVSVIMCGKNNQFGHPDSEILKRLEALGSEIYRTDLHGNIIFYSDGKTFTLTTEKK